MTCPTWLIQYMLLYTCCRFSLIIYKRRCHSSILCKPASTQHCNSLILINKLTSFGVVYLLSANSRPNCTKFLISCAGWTTTSSASGWSVHRTISTDSYSRGITALSVSRNWSVKLIKLLRTKTVAIFLNFFIILLMCKILDLTRLEMTIEVRVKTLYL